MTQKIINVMLDLETLGTKPGCKILSIGACTFADDASILSDRKTYYAVIDRNTQALLEDPATVNWWYAQDKEAQKELFENVGQIHITQALHEFAMWLTALNLENKYKVRIWGNSASFDLKILEHVYLLYNLPVPWAYKNEMCFRTLKNLFAVSFPANEKPHHALSDAIWQADIAEEIFDELLVISSRGMVSPFTGLEID